MSTDVAVRSHSTDLTITADQTMFNDRQVAALRQLGVDSASNADLAVFFHQSVRTGLDPFVRQIYMIERQGKQTIQTGIDGFRLIARRAVDRSGETLGYGDTLWCGDDGAWTDVWLRPEHPAAAKVMVLRNGQPYSVVALYSEYVALKRDGNPNSMWSSKSVLMLAKCAEALALRKAFPQDLSGIYSSDEMGQAANTVAAPAAVRQVVQSGPARDWQLEVDSATTEEELRALYRQAREANAPGEVPTAIVAAVERLRAAAAPPPEEEPIEGVIVEEPPEQDLTAAGEQAATEQPPVQW